MTAEMTVVIPCRSDIKLSRALRSVDDSGSQILVVLNRPSAQVQTIVQEFGVDSLELESDSLGVAREEGIRAARTSKILFLDSDCIVAPGSLVEIRAKLDEAPVVRPLLVYESVGFASRTVARLRQYTTASTALPLLPLAFRKEIAPAIGGYFFRADLNWGEDQDFAKRIVAANLGLIHLKNAQIRHVALDFIADLRSAFMLGRGRWYQVQSGLAQRRSLARDALFIGELDKARKALRECGWAAAVYHMFGWRVAYKLGYHFAAQGSKDRQRIT